MAKWKQRKMPTRWWQKDAAEHARGPYDRSSAPEDPLSADESPGPEELCTSTGSSTMTAEPREEFNSPPANEPIPEARQLCTLCDTVDIRAIFKAAMRKGATIPLSERSRDIGTMEHLSHCHECVLCQCGREAASEYLQTDPTRADHIWGVMPEIVIRAELLRPKSVARAFRLAVYARGVAATDCKHILGRLDIVNDPPIRKDHFTMFSLHRQRLKPSFDPLLLSSWLQKCPPTQQTDRQIEVSALDGLLQDAKFRLIDVRSGWIIAPTTPRSYAALSYVWGHSGHRTSSCIHTYKRPYDNGTRQRVDFAYAPRTISDAARLVREIGQRYLWVDSICIKQDVHEDKSAVVSQMDAIYSCAYLTTVAADGAHADAGLVRLHSSASCPETPFSFWQRDKLTTMLPSRPRIEDIISSTVWGTRGWTFQERLLSPRCVFFTLDEVVFTAYRIQEREGYSLSAVHQQGNARKYSRKHIRLARGAALLTVYEAILRLLQNSREDYSLSGISHYRQAVEDFSARSLSRQEDRNSAFQGIFNVFFRNSYTCIRDSYNCQDTEALNGMHPDIPWNCLFWQPLSNTKRIRSSPGSRRPPPSWSWCGWTGPVSFLDEVVESRHSFVKHDAQNIYLSEREWNEGISDFETRTHEERMIHLSSKPHLTSHNRAVVDNHLPVVLHIHTYLLKGTLVPVRPADHHHQVSQFRRYNIRLGTGTSTTCCVKTKNGPLAEDGRGFVTHDPVVFDSIYSEHAHSIEIPLPYDPAPSAVHSFVYLGHPIRDGKWADDDGRDIDRGKSRLDIRRNLLLSASCLILVKARVDRTDMFERVALSELRWAVHPRTYAHNKKQHVMLV